MREKIYKIGITIGDINGIGPEVIIRALSSLPVAADEQICLIGPQAAFYFWGERVGDNLWREVLRNRGAALSIVEPDEIPSPQFTIGQPTEVSGKIAARSIISATELALSGKIDAIVTAPISKNALQRAGYNFPGHTEFFASLADVCTPVMLMMTEKIRIAVATTHVPLKSVAALVTVKMLVEKIEILHRELQDRFGIRHPGIAVTALNPHAGEGGKIGSEETEVIEVALRAVQKKGIDATGPYPADSLFSYNAGPYVDAYLAMYHDQGLIPFKMLAAGKGVNYTCGLPFIRTSPDHGTAFDIAGRNRANFSSMLEAIRRAKSQGSINRRG